MRKKNINYKLIETFLNHSKKHNNVDLLNEQDIEGSTVVHYAARFGYAHALKRFIAQGAKTSTKTNDRESPLHLAAKHGRFLSCLLLIDSQSQKNYINDKDKYGKSDFPSAC